jgi:hypothetical protein
MTADSEGLARSLRRRAEAILAATGLMTLFADRFGAAALTGSARYDLMAWPDIDIHMPVAPEARLEYAALMPEIGRRLELAGLRLHRASFLDDYVDPHPLGAGLYWGIEFRDADGTPWKADLWGWAPRDFARRQEDDQILREQLAGADRGLILRLKAEARQRPGYYGKLVSSMDIYRFVVAGAGESLEALEMWKAAGSSSS